MRYARGNHLDGRRLQPFHHVLGQQWRGDIDVLYVKREQSVANGSPDIACLAIERRDQRCEATSLRPFCAGHSHASQPSLFPRLFRIPAVIPQMR